MSRIGKKEIIVPKNVTISIEPSKLIAKGIFGSLEQTIPEEFHIEIEDEKIRIQKIGDAKRIRALHGLIRANIQNILLGVSQRFSKILIVEGIGYKFQLDKKKLILHMGYSHLIERIIPQNLEVSLESSNKLIIRGINKQEVGLFASEIRKIRPPEPYKGKGIRYEKEVILRKTGKTGK